MTQQPQKPRRKPRSDDRSASRARPADGGAARGTDHGEVIPVVEETLEVDRREVETGRVRVQTRVEEREETADAPLRRERVEVERVPIGVEVESAPPVREEDGVTVVPVMEEVLVVEKRLVLKEEVRIRRVVEEVRDPKTVRLRRSIAEVHREGGDSPERASRAGSPRTEAEPAEEKENHHGTSRSSDV